MDPHEASRLLDLGVMKDQDDASAMMSVNSCFVTPENLGIFSAYYA